MREYPDIHVPHIGDWGEYYAYLKAIRSVKM